MPAQTLAANVLSDCRGPKRVLRRGAADWWTEGLKPHALYVPLRDRRLHRISSSAAARKPTKLVTYASRSSPSAPAGVAAGTSEARSRILIGPLELRQARNEELRIAERNERPLEAGPSDEAYGRSVNLLGQGERLRLLPGDGHAGADDRRNGFAPVYAALRKDPATAQMIETITALKRTVKPMPLVIQSAASPRAASPPRPLRRSFPTASTASARRRKTSCVSGRTPTRHRPVCSSAQQHSDSTTAPSAPSSAAVAYPAVGAAKDATAPPGQLSPRLGRAFTDASTFKHRHARPSPLAYQYGALHFRVLGAEEPTDRVTWEANPFVRIG